MADFCLKDHLTFLPCKKSKWLQQDQGKSQCPEFLLQFKVQCFGACRRLSSHGPHPGCVASLLFISGSLLEPVCGARRATGCAAARATGLWLPEEHTGQCITKSARESPRGSLPKSTWPMERSGQCTVQVQVLGQ